jgi:hypothetical protein
VGHEDDPVGELDDDSAIERGTVIRLPRTRRGTGERSPVDSGGRVRASLETHTLAGAANLYDRIATEIAVGERTRGASAWWRELRCGARELDLARRQLHTFADARDIWVRRDR